MAINQRQIASKLNLSVATISRSLKNDRAINPQTRARVVEAARQMGYSTPPNYSAIDDESEKKPFCVLIQTDAKPGTSIPLGHSIVPEVLTGMSETAFRLSTSMLVHYVSRNDRDRAAAPELLPKALCSGTAVGVVLVHYYPPETMARFAVSFPCVSLIYDHKLPNMDVVGPNNTDAMVDLLYHLHQYGHRRIAFAGRMKEYGVHRARLTGFLASALDLDLPISLEDIFDFSDEFNRDEVMNRLCATIRQKGLTAVVCGDDEEGYPLIAALQQAGISVPKEVSVTGFDMIQPPKELPVLTSVTLPALSMGAAAVMALRERISNPMAPARRITLDCTLFEGETVACVTP